uniref:Uncharacterized protein n=1 Tax=Glossina morsitans morsitans TaxID=37546 RepID=A0A1B0GD23_GLOMM
MSLKYDIRVKVLFHPPWVADKGGKYNLCYAHICRMLVDSKSVHLKRYKLLHLTIDMWRKRSRSLTNNLNDALQTN